MKNEVAVKEKNEVMMPPGAQASDWGSPEISGDDIIIPHIWLMQPMSDKVTAGDAAFGDFRSSLDNSKIGDLKQGFEIVPICMKKSWIEYDVTQGDDFKNKKYLRVMPITPENEGLPYKDTQDAGKVKISRDKLMSFYVLLVKDLELGGAIPHVITFRRTGIDAGKTLITQMMVKNGAANKPPPAVTCLITCVKTANDAGTWVVPQVTPVKPTTDAYIAEAFKWFQLIQKGKATAVEADFAGEEVKSSGASVETGPQEF